MSTVTSPPSAWPVDRLAAALIEGTTGADWDRVAAVRLLVEHGAWLHRGDFREHVEADELGGAWLDLASLAARVDGPTPLRGSSSELAVLRLACTLAGRGPVESADVAQRWTLRAILRPLGHANATLAVQAIRFAALGPGGVR